MRPPAYSRKTKEDAACRDEIDWFVAFLARHPEIRPKPEALASMAAGTVQRKTLHNFWVRYRKLVQNGQTAPEPASAAPAASAPAASAQAAPAASAQAAPAAPPPSPAASSMDLDFLLGECNGGGGSLLGIELDTTVEFGDTLEKFGDQLFAEHPELMDWVPPSL